MAKQKNHLAKRAKPTQVEAHWSKLLEGLQFSPQEFYQRVERALQTRQVPNLDVSRVDWKEGGPLSARREYLRLQRERLVFDICAAPFGTGFFVSEWIGERPLSLLWALLMLVGVVIAGFLLVMTGPHNWYYIFMLRSFGLWYMQSTFVLVSCIVLIFLGFIIWLGTRLDNALIGFPILGPLYERYFRKITYYRVDLQCMYKAAVHAAVLEVIDEITKAKGIAPLSEFDRRPAMDALVGQLGKSGNGRR
jgi:hypothetical protein